MTRRSRRDMPRRVEVFLRDDSVGDSRALREALEDERLCGVDSLTIVAAEMPTRVHAAHTALQPECARRGLRLTIAFVLDDGADVGAALADRPSSLTEILRATRALCPQGVSVAWWIPLSPALVFRLETLYSLARDEGVEPLLLPVEALGSCGAPAGRPLEPDERLFAWDFITYRVLEEERARLSPGRWHDYVALQSALAANGTTAALRTERIAVIAESAGDWGLRFEERIKLAALDAGVGPPGAETAGHLRETVTHAREVAGVLFDGIRGLGQWTLTKATASARRQFPPPGGELRRVLLIGAYGGEHIGDAAILGGVLLRIHERYATTQAVLMSQRPAHTRHLIPMLDVPVAVEVHPYEHAPIREALAEVDAVVYAGGPIADLPKQLVRHLYVASRARRRGLPFIVEGIGAGPFARKPSLWVGRRIVELADHLAVRTLDDGRHALVRGLAPQLSRDPAFDYLETRPPMLTRLPAVDRRWIDALLQGTDGRLCIGVNLRPILHHLYTEGAGDRDPAEYSRAIESRFEERFVEGLRRFHEATSPRPCFIFYPMNAIQFGSSDLRSAYRILRLAGKAVDLRVWEGDATLDGVVALLRRLDIVVSMRFHATIFALSQDRPVIGVDYRIGKRYKVASLLADHGQSHNVTRIDELTSEWLCERLLALGANPANTPHRNDEE